MSQTAKSWLALSGSMINVSLGRPKLSGLSDDHRATANKLLGFAGYFISVVTTTPLALGILFARKLPIILSSPFFVVAAPFIAIGKPIGKKVNGHRFDNSDNRLFAIRAFKNLYSALNPFGKFNEGKAILENQAGNKGPLTFIRKIFTINTSTATEKIMDALLMAYKKFTADRPQENPKTFFEGEEFNQVVSKVVEKSYTVNYLASQAYLEEKQEEVRKTGEFIREYVLSHEDVKKPKPAPQKIYSQKTLRNTFWGKSVNNPEQAVYPISEQGPSLK
jgi:hypothetical protein